MEYDERERLSNYIIGTGALVATRAVVARASAIALRFIVILPNEIVRFAAQVPREGCRWYSLTGSGLRSGLRPKPPEQQA